MWRVVWQFARNVMGAVGALLPSTTVLTAAASPHFLGLTIHGDVERVFLGHAANIRSSLLALHPAQPFDALLDLSGYYHAYFASKAEALTAAGQLRNDPNIRYAEIQPPLATPVRFSERRLNRMELAADSFPTGPSPNLTAEQGYLDAAPGGLDARFAWRTPGAGKRGTLALNTINLTSERLVRRADAH
jgi:hypothetical protein